MEIDETTKQIWNKRLKHLPKTILAKELNLTRPTITNALNGKCNLNTMIKINNWLIANKDKELTKTENL